MQCSAAPLLSSLISLKIAAHRGVGPGTNMTSAKICRKDLETRCISRHTETYIYIYIYVCMHGHGELPPVPPQSDNLARGCALDSRCTALNSA